MSVGNVSSPAASMQVWAQQKQQQVGAQGVQPHHHHHHRAGGAADAGKADPGAGVAPTTGPAAANDPTSIVNLLA
jgi:hypothetical protein